MSTLNALGRFMLTAAALAEYHWYAHVMSKESETKEFMFCAQLHSS